MDTTTSTHKLPVHEHPLLLSERFFLAECGGCHVTETLYGGYFCNEASCNRWFHKECAKAPLEINHHPSHPDHPLLITCDSPARGDTPCDSCGQKILPPCYTCTTCEYKVDFICGIKPSPSVIEHPVSHDHPLVFFKKREEKEVPCEVCKESIGGPFYSCLECNNVYFHLDCVHLPKEVLHPCHSSHPLTIANYSYGCYLCSTSSRKYYHCYICDIYVCLGCTKRPPPLVVNHTKTHKHPLRLLLSKFIQFTCNLCGVEKYGTVLYVCFECGLLVHKKCVGLPQVININRHDHRIYFKHHLGYGSAYCGVYCGEGVRKYYGAYSCSICPNYAVHLHCAIDSTVWNGLELEGVQETSEDISPFEVVGDNLIRQFIHGNHNLLLLKDYVMVREYYEWLRCDACVCPIGFGPFYKCLECPFFLHEKCANLPKKKKLVFDTTTYQLEDVGRTLYCLLCGILSSGLVFKLQGLDGKYQYVDVRCGSISEPFNHDGHRHPLCFGKTKLDCDGCGRKDQEDIIFLICPDCGFRLCFYCANLPGKIWHMRHEHALTLIYHEHYDRRWCEVCEKRFYTRLWFFTCPDCRVTFHVNCVMGDFSHLKLNGCITIKRRKYKVVLNNHSTRPFCRQCRDRCKVQHILKEEDEQKNGYICSISCLSSFSGVEFEFHGLV